MNKEGELSYQTETEAVPRLLTGYDRGAGLRYYCRTLHKVSSQRVRADVRGEEGLRHQSVSGSRGAAL
ncbi:hypothetical protein EB796_007209 [Bugula neritina]|uniref:Uncharacterized protein n=1 Tax=Bugula neritina TaxID=10212 RepID=A0A7J7KA47_BUGNE|nr:hypothetical protein EB796_007209 [Bugula neritina]